MNRNVEFKILPAEYGVLVVCYHGGDEIEQHLVPVDGVAATMREFSSDADQVEADAQDAARLDAELACGWPLVYRAHEGRRS